MHKLFRFLSVFACLVAVFGLTCAFDLLPGLRAAGFGGGNIVVYRVGDGVTALNANAAAVFLDEYTPSGTLVQSIPMPTTVSGLNKRFTGSGSATSEGELTLSSDGHYLVAAGYDAGTGMASMTSSTSAAVNRVIARIDSTGTVDTTTALTDAISGGNPRGAASTNGLDLWLSGTSSGGGIRYAAFGSTTSTALGTTPTTNIRQVNIFQGQLYVSSASSTIRIATVGTGTPTSGPQIFTQLTGVPATLSSPYGFFLTHLNGPGSTPDTLYFADDNTAAGSTGGLSKYSLVGGTWVSSGNTGLNLGVRSITGVVSGGVVTLYLTSSTGLYSFVDATGYDAALVGAPTNIASAGTNKAFRGVAFAPIGTAPTNPMGTFAAAPNPVQAGNTTLLTVAVARGTNPLSTGLAVTADLTAIGGASSQTFFDDGTHGDATAGDNVFSFQATVPISVVAGIKSLTAIVSDAQARSSNATLMLTVSPASTSPTGTGAASPGALHAGDTTLLTVTVVPGTNPLSTGLSVTANLSAIGGSAAQSFFDDGSNGDVNAGDNVFSYQIAIGGTTPAGPITLPVTVADAQGRSSSASIALTIQPPPPPTTIKISQVYGGGGNSGATYTNDFVEIFNAGPTPIDLSGWSVQYTSAGGSGTWQVTPIACTPSSNCVVAPGRYFLVQEAPGSGGTTPLPGADISGSIPMSLSAGKVALLNSPIALVGACPTAGTAADFVAYGSANCAEGNAPAPTLTNSKAAIRSGNGCTDTGNNAADFVTDGPIPRNSASPVNGCGGDPTMPSGLGTAIPDSVLPASNTLLTVRVTSASAPPSTGLSVVANVTSIGGSSMQPFYDDGTHGDQVAGDNIFSLETTIGAAVSTGTYSVVATVTDSQGRSVAVPLTLSVQSLTCGVERWAVKVGTDSTVGQVRLDLPPTPATIEALGQITPPSEADIDSGDPAHGVPPGQFAFTRDAPVETTLYQVDGTMTFYKLETDVDYHIVLSDLGTPTEHTIITEIPNPGCIITTDPPRTLVPSPLAAGIANAREKFDARLTATPFFQSVSIPVRVRGVGFFDFEHGQTGVAPNAIEIHPILDIFFRANTTTTLQSIGTPQFGQLVTFSTTVTNGSGSTAPGGTATFFDGGNSYTAALDANGQASFSSSTLAPGSHTITVSYEGDDTDLPSQSSPLVLDVAKGDQSIDFAPLTGKTYGNAPFTVSATGGASSSTVTFAASGNCSASGALITINGAGSCVVTASQAGDVNYNAAADVLRAFAIAPAPLVVKADNVTAEFGALPTFTGTLTGAVGADGITASYSSPATSTSPVGQYPIVPTLVDPNHRLANYSVTAINGILTIVDTTPPAISAVIPSVTSIWPPNDRMVPVTIAVTVHDAADPAPACSITGVSANEGTSADWAITGPLSVNLRAYREGTGTGRDYTITVRCTDASGNTSTATTDVGVPHDQGQ